MDPFDTPMVENASLSQQGGGHYPYVNYHRGQVGDGSFMGSASLSNTSSSHSMPTNQQTLADRVQQLEAALQSLRQLPEHIQTPSWPPTTVTSVPSAPRSMYPSFAHPPCFSNGWYGVPLGQDAPPRDLLCEPLITTSNDVPMPSYRHTPTPTTPVDPWTMFPGSDNGVRHGFSPAKPPSEILVDPEFTPTVSTESTEEKERSIERMRRFDSQTITPLPVEPHAGWGPQDASKPKEGETVTLTEVQSLLGHMILRQGGPIVWGCTRELNTISRSSCESEIYAADEGTKSILTVRHLLQDLNMKDGFSPTPLWNDNRGCVDWSKGCTVSRKLRHINMQNLSVRLAQQKQDISIKHVDGKRNIADILTKEHKDAEHFRGMMRAVTSPRQYSLALLEKQLNYPTKGGVKGRRACNEGQPTLILSK